MPQRAFRAADGVCGSYASVAAQPSEEVEAPTPKSPPAATLNDMQSNQSDNAVAVSQSSTVTLGQRHIIWESLNFGDAEEDMQAL